MKKLSVAAALAAALIAVSLSSGSSHREAPNIMLDPAADNTDTYAFTAPDAPDALTVVANWVPGGNPANGPNFFRFDDRARYYIHIDNTGDGKPDISYRYEFKSTFPSDSYRQGLPGVRSIDDPRLQEKQSYRIVREELEDGEVTRKRTIARDLPVAPSNAGPKTFPDYDQVANQAIRDVGDGKYFAGQRDDAFFIDLGAAFDNVNLRVPPGNLGGGTDTQADTSIQTITMQVPEADVTRDGEPVSGPDADNATVGVWAATERRKLEVTNGRFDNKRARGSWVQVSRLGNILVNELFIPASEKDQFNKTTPATDGERFKRFLLEPEFAKQINNLPEELGVSALDLKAPETDRDDLVDVFLTGIEGLNQIGDDPVAADTLKINMGVPPAQTPNRFGLIGGDRAGFPNGRRLADDATDIYVQLVGGFMKGNKIPAGDGVDQNDKPFLDRFPYQSSPSSGYDQAVGRRVEPPHAPTLPGNDPQVPIGPQVPTPRPPAGPQVP
ncbi:MAG: DUF4331 domain-containing protein [Solirubrobacteraceae bacterium MAG38_C4-C5]|nr:DUF4331 domain-containing protein [Candidatus Siliceabacter maunaloa]